MDSIGHFIVRAPRGGPFSLQQRCLWALTHHYVTKIEEIIFQHSWKDYESILSLIQGLFIDSILKLPSELAQKVVNCICSSQNEETNFALVLSLLSCPEAHQHNLELSLELLESSNALKVIPCSRSFGPGLVKFTAISRFMNDDILIALANSSSAISLKSLEMGHSMISDASAHIWDKFSSLEELEISYCSLIGLETAQAIARGVPSLTTLIAPSSDGLSLKELDSIFVDNLLPNLEIIHLSLNVRPEENVADAFLFRRTNLRQIRLGWIVLPNDQITKIHKALPNLELKLPGKALQYNSAEAQDTLYASTALRQLHIPTDLTGMETQGDIIQLSKRLPRLEQLTWKISHPKLPTDLSIFSSLTTFSSSLLQVAGVIKWPISLVSMHLGDPDEEEDMDQDSAPVSSPFFDSLHSLTNLKHLIVDKTNQSVLNAFPRLLAELTQLTNIMLLPAPSNSSAKLHFTKLNDLPLISTFSIGFGATVDPSSVYLPSLNSSNEARWLPFSELNSEQLPNLTEVHFYDLPPEQVEIILQRWGRQLQTIKGLTLDPARIFSPDLFYLTSLEIREPIPESSVVYLIENLQKLTHFSVVVFRLLSSPDWSWIKHNRINLLDITWVKDKKGAPTNQAVANVTTEVKTSECGLTSADLPALRKLSMNLGHQKISKISILKLESLGTLHVMSQATTDKIELEIDDCHFLHQVIIMDLDLNSLRMINLPNLLSLSLYRCAVTENDADIVLRLPRLQSLNVNPKNERLSRDAATNRLNSLNQRS